MLIILHVVFRCGAEADLVDGWVAVALDQWDLAREVSLVSRVPQACQAQEDFQEDFQEDQWRLKICKGMVSSSSIRSQQKYYCL